MPAKSSPAIFKSEEQLARLSASERIRYRLVGANCRYHANDNISAFIEGGEMEELQAEVEAKMQEVLQALVIDTESDHNTHDTAMTNSVMRGAFLKDPNLRREFLSLLPNEHSNLIGLSKYARICDWIMSRPQIQEEPVMMLANELQMRVKPDGLALVMEADHFCMHWRGVKDTEAKMINSVMRGSFLKDVNLRREFLSLLDRKST